ncbi:hypothetical protein BaRGS_00000333 [Batillaria attramentaria]|uniref:Uncharacterized protein n=1 Tax=Batillaria attramentaria TaxID=370345 RepID=A0ABD0M8D3_9CAEN
MQFRFSHGEPTQQALDHQKYGDRPTEIPRCKLLDYVTLSMNFAMRTWRPGHRIVTAHPQPTLPLSPTGSPHNHPRSSPLIPALFQSRSSAANNTGTHDCHSVP